MTADEGVELVLLLTDVLADEGRTVDALVCLERAVAARGSTTPALERRRQRLIAALRSGTSREPRRAPRDADVESVHD